MQNPTFEPRNTREAYEFAYRLMRGLAQQDDLPLMGQLDDPIERKALESFVVMRSAKRGFYSHPTPSEQIAYWRKYHYDVSYMLRARRSYGGLL